MLPVSHVPPTIRPVPVPLEDPRALADAFSAFISASVTLEGSYRSLQQEVERLGGELVERNAVLRTALAENEQIRSTLQQMMDSLPCGVLVIDARQGIVMINPAGRRFLNLGDARFSSLGEVTGFAGLELDAFCSASMGDFEAEIPVGSAPDTRWLGVSRHAIHTTTAAACGKSHASDIETVWILRDITAAKQAEREREAARAAVALAEISTVLAHEIRNPLASMELFAGLVMDEPARTSEWITNLRAGIRLLSGTVDNVLRMHCDIPQQLIPIQLKECIASGVEFVRPIAEQAGISLVLTEGEAFSILGNQEAIKQVLLNLVRNAIRYTPAGGRITITTERIRGVEAGRVRVLIADSGCGIATELLDHLLEPGVSGDGSTPGLGLAVCRRLMAQHRGAIKLSSRVGTGTTVELEFPCL
jgi:signal transduction histidine kinase